MSQLITVGIRQLVEFCCRRGDLGGSNGPGPSALEGIQTHQKIQRRYAHQAQAEQALKFTTRIDEFEVELGGRVDLVFADEQPPRLEEIKTVYSFAQVGDSDMDAPHWAQVKCYAACYALQQDLDSVSAGLNYVRLSDQQERRENQVFTRAELEAFLLQTLAVYVAWQRLVRSHQAATQSSASALLFPFADYRAQQQYFARSVYRAIQQGRHLLVEAPTGSGKTISTLFPAVKAIGEDIADQVIYLSAKTWGQDQAVKAVETMCERGLQIGYLVIQAKAKSCPCNSDEQELDEAGKCTRCIGFFDRLPAAREELMNLRSLTPLNIRGIADRHRLCPFELTLQMLPWSDIIVCDFNYIFDPLVRLEFFNSTQRRQVLLIDEMHNLVDRARGMYSASLRRAQVKQAAAATNGSALKRAISAIGTALDKHARAQLTEEDISNEIPAALTRACLRFGEKLDQDLFDNKRLASETLDFAREVFRFQCIANLYDQHHKTISQQALAKREVKLLCLNAFEYLQKIYPGFTSVCGFSATLSPAGYFLPALGLAHTAQALSLDSSFPTEQLGVSIGSYIDTRYRQRDGHIGAICDSIERCYRARPGNYLVFFSSYAFMQKVLDQFNRQFPEIDTLVQQRGSSDQQREDFLQQFFTRDQRLGFVIMGGIFAEGIDYSGPALIGAIVVGVGLPQANTEQQLIEQDFNAMQLDGFDYAYKFPGLTRVLQSAGRVIRSDHDRGVVVLLDRRFQQPGYRNYFPQHWQGRHCHNLDALQQSLAEFWDRQDGEH